MINTSVYTAEVLHKPFLPQYREQYKYITEEAMVQDAKVNCTHKQVLAVSKLGLHWSCLA